MARRKKHTLADNGGREALEKIVATAKHIKSDVDAYKKPRLSFPIRSLKNVVFDEKKGIFRLAGGESVRDLSYTTVKTFAQSLRMMALSKTLIETDDIATKREVYYMSKNWVEAKFNEQPESDTIMDDIEAMLGAIREQLGFIPDKHGGGVVGEVIVTDKAPDTGKLIHINCAEQGTGAWSVPPNVEHLKFKTKAKFILVIETTGMFQRLVKHAFWKTADCILVAMGGVPSRACRRFIRKLADERRIPVYVFTDGDPYGYTNIYRTLKVGSGNAAHLNEFFCVPQAKYLGVTPDDIVKYDLPTHPLKEVDVKRAKDALKNDPFVKHHRKWKSALKKLVKMGVRAEQQALAAHGLNYVIDTYLPEKLKNQKTFLP